MPDTFPIVPGASKTLWILLLFLLVVFLGVTALMVTTARGATASEFDVSAEGLRLRGDMYGRLIPASALRGEGIRIVDLSAEKALKPRWRTMGTAVGGYQAGWFKLNNGERALLYLTDRTRAVYVPTTAGYSVILSPQEPERFVERVRAVARGGG